MSKYGLQLRVKPQQKKQPTKRPIPTPLGFNDDDDEDNVEREILRQAYKNKTHKDIEEQHKKALEEDPSVFDYDGVYDKMKEEQVRPIEKERQDRKSKYIQTLTEKAQQRKREQEITYERKLAKERSKDEHLFADKEKFVTSAFKRKLEEQAKWEEEERLRRIREEKEDVTKKTDLSDFYFNLGKNVAYGARNADSRKPEKLPEEQVSPPPSLSSELIRIAKSHQDEIAENLSPEVKSDRQFTKPVPDTSTQDQVIDEPSTSNQPKVGNEKREDEFSAAKDHHKRSVDAVTAAKERFLARKKSKV